jgi:undecaprenyl-diphosphatase
MSIIQAIILGLVQGITEFLPVSSSGHLALLQKIFGIEGNVFLFDIALHLGTLLAVFVVLRNDITNILKRPFQKLSGLLIVSTLITAVFALLLKKIPAPQTGLSLLESAGSSTGFLGCAFLTTALLLFAAEKLSKHAPSRTPVREKEDRAATISVLDAVIIGAAQGLGILPGVSRSGSTLAGALARNPDRDFAARYSFLLAIPAILGALVLELKDSFDAGAPVFAGIGTGAVIAGTASAAIVGFFAVNSMLRIVRTKKLYGFSIYTALLGIIILFDTFITKLFF